MAAHARTFAVASTSAARVASRAHRRETVVSTRGGRARPVARGFRWPFAGENAEDDNTSLADAPDNADMSPPRASPVDEESRAARVAQMTESYTERAPSMGAGAPPLPPGYRVRIKLGDKTRVEVVAGEDDELVGWVTCWRKNKYASRRRDADSTIGGSLFLSSVEVKPPHRRIGVASRLLHEAEALASSPAFACDEASLTVVKNNVAAIALYERAGYVVDEGGESAAERVRTMLWDPQRVMQHRMAKPLRRDRGEGDGGEGEGDGASAAPTPADGGGPGGFYDR